MQYEYRQYVLNSKISVDTHMFIIVVYFVPFRLRHADFCEDPNWEDHHP